MITVYKKSNGEIVKVCTCMQSDIPLQYDPVIEAYIEGNYDYNNYYIENNQPVTIPESPDKYSIFNYDTKQWVDPRTNATQWVVVRQQRNQLLLTSDWTDTLSAKVRLGDATYTAWQEYRQALRDITTQTDPFNITWPVSPT
jgi:hypothetical protein